LSSALREWAPKLSEAAAVACPRFPPKDSDTGTQEEENTGADCSDDAEAEFESEEEIARREPLLSPAALLLSLTALTVEPLCWTLDRAAVAAAVSAADTPVPAPAAGGAAGPDVMTVPPAPATADTLRALAAALGAPLTLAAEGSSWAAGAVSGSAVARVLCAAPQVAALVGGTRPDAGSFERAAIKTAQAVYAVYNGNGIV
jgi:hypothetical protein